MGLKFERADDLDKLFESFAVDPDKEVKKDADIQKFLKPKNDDTDKKRIKPKADPLKL
ncbi:SPJ_0845 family protein [Enterococcus devriesei]|uniref:SPJ_0845 family protein n=1 Tax=Enterococcus devriesei TaxID=319970 RepID=UPI00288FED0D|nr:SPJ_0845 family protein [Enterococcus devriesei]MDT2820537.1 SPJ_0845 family protein [Enterococcus devriesei]